MALAGLSNIVSYNIFGNLTVLMKLLDHPDTEPLVGALTELARQEAPGADIYFEYNPTTMM